MLTNAAPLTRVEVEDFLIHEAYLLDDWKLQEWAELFTEDGEYLIAPLDEPTGDPGKTLFLISDDRERLQGRAKRLLSKAAHSEYPRSRTTHLVGNVRIVEQDADSVVVRSAFIVTRAKGPINDTYPGHCSYRLARTPGGLRIRSKRIALDLTSLRPQGKISIIL